MLAMEAGAGMQPLHAHHPVAGCAAVGGVPCMPCAHPSSAPASAVRLWQHTSSPRARAMQHCSPAEQQERALILQGHNIKHAMLGTWCMQLAAVTWFWKTKPITSRSSAPHLLVQPPLQGSRRVESTLRYE